MPAPPCAQRAPFLLCALLVGCIDLPADLPDVDFDAQPADGDASPRPLPDPADAALDPADGDPSADGGAQGPRPETCNGRDDDLDDSVDEGVRNACGACGAVPDEACDGFDNDCDLIVDEAASCECSPGIEQVCGVDVGRCVAGVRICDASGRWGACSAVGPQPEVCDGVDDDCDERVDEGVLNRCGQCGALPADVCNGLDDDCDGVIDGRDGAGEVCPCDLGTRQACGRDEGICRTGEQICTADGWSDCEGGRGPGPEACDGQDDDCDGAVDEDWPDVGERCAVGLGVCRAFGVRICAGDAASTTCSATAGMPDRIEVCNGLDDDCDDAVDERLFLRGCMTFEPGVCAQGDRVCDDGALECVRRSEPSAETCNGVDDDCDGTVDEGFRAQTRLDAYATLAMLHPACDGEAQLTGPDCNAAIHRACAADGCFTSGFGPIEQANGDAHRTCVSTAAVRAVTYQALGQYVGACDGQPAEDAVACNTAIHLWCRDEGFVSGFGAVESRAAEVDVACVPEPAAVFETTFAVLAEHHPGCDRLRPASATDCHAAIHRFCRDAQGRVSGYGPVGVRRAAVEVVCVDR